MPERSHSLGNRLRFIYVGVAGIKFAAFHNILVLLFIVSLFSSCAGGLSLGRGQHDEHHREKEISHKIQKHLPIGKFKILKSQMKGKLLEVIVERNDKLYSFYLVEDALIYGDLWKDRVNVSSRSLASLRGRLFLKHKKEIDSLIGFTYSPPKIKSDSDLYMFTEPLCPYCHKTGEFIFKLAKERGFRVHLLFFSVHDQEGEAKCIEAICRNESSGGKFNLEQYNDSAWRKERKSPTKNCKRGMEIVKRTRELAEKLNLEGVPIIFNERGDFVEGFEKEEISKLSDMK